MSPAENNAPLNDEDRLKRLQAMEEFLKNRPADETRVHHIEQDVQVSLSGGRLNFPSYTKSWMEKQANRSIQTLTIQTDPATQTVYLWPDPKGERKLVFNETMSSASVAFAVPLRKMKLSFKDNCRVVLPLHFEELPTMGPVFWVSFTEVTLEGRSIDKALIAAAKQVQTEVKKVRRAARIQRTLGRIPKPDTTSEA